MALQAQTLLEAKMTSGAAGLAEDPLAELVDKTAVFSERDEHHR